MHVRRRISVSLLACAAVGTVIATAAMRGLRTAFASRPITIQRSLGIKRRAGPLELLREPLEAYSAARVADSPFLAEAPEAVLHWGHAAAMAAVYLQLFNAAYMGWQIRNGKGDEATALSLGQSSRTLHPLLSLGAWLFFLVGGQGGFVLLTAQKQTILESPHAATALLGMLLLTVQGSLPLVFGSGSALRSVHAYLGSAIVLLMVIHAALGISLGFSF
eukprot:TRINITY_DN55133_c0_g1_i1.p1 TRINITY_DN55133_c0_g1~~TRINITY_DN55133_c0_g1_i1.p1  ORF type:complete len:219 (+),score=37.10 TRINITY_DN55133_c0_g1_i1:166-822(+)